MAREMTVYVLMMNDMRSSNIENLSAVRQGSDRAELRAWHDALRVLPYKDGRWCKTFVKDSPLEWFNPVDERDWEKDGPYFGGVYVAHGAVDGTDFLGVRLTKW